MQKFWVLTKSVTRIDFDFDKGRISKLQNWNWNWRKILKKSNFRIKIKILKNSDFGLEFWNEKSIIDKLASFHLIWDDIILTCKSPLSTGPIPAPALGSLLCSPFVTLPLSHEPRLPLIQSLTHCAHCPNFPIIEKTLIVVVEVPSRHRRCCPKFHFQLCKHFVVEILGFLLFFYLLKNWLLF